MTKRDFDDDNEKTATVAEGSGKLRVFSRVYGGSFWGKGQHQHKIFESGHISQIHQAAYRLINQAQKLASPIPHVSHFESRGHS